MWCNSRQGENTYLSSNGIMSTTMIKTTTSGKKYRFFYHYYKQKKKMSIHFRKSCVVVDDIECKVPCETKWNKTMPNLVMQGYCHQVRFEGNKAIIE